MPLSIEDILKETATWPDAQKNELITKLQDEVLSDFATPEIEESWAAEVDRRLREIEADRSVLLDGDEVLRKLQARVHQK
ncbi:MAG TPA: addiction module protein [Methylomirabilota bacterium]|nr:addiction module protein [Methylomirabilota bacterium]